MVWSVSAAFLKDKTQIYILAAGFANSKKPVAITISLSSPEC